MTPQHKRTSIGFLKIGGVPISLVTEIIDHLFDFGRGDIGFVREGDLGAGPMRVDWRSSNDQVQARWYELEGNDWKVWITFLPLDKVLGRKILKNSVVVIDSTMMVPTKVRIQGRRGFLRDMTYLKLAGSKRGDWERHGI